MKHKKSAPENPERMLAFRVEEVQNEGQDQERSADPLGCAGKLCVERLGLVLAHEAVVVAGNGRGQTGAFAGLERHDRDERDGENNLNNGQNSVKSSHNFLQT